MKGFNPYLTFNGNCREALDFYKDCFNGAIDHLSTFGDAKMGETELEKNRVMHAAFKAGSIFFMASDSMPGQPVADGSNVTLNIDFQETGDQQKVFDKLSRGGKVTMPLADTFWGARFGMLTDKFGIKWMTNCELKKS
jgi:PhnB protein